MTTNMHVAFSDTIKGVGLFSGGPYGIYYSSRDDYSNFFATGKLLNEQYECNLNMYHQDMAARSTDREKVFVSTAQNFQLERKLDSLENLVDSPVYIFSPTDDRVMPPIFQYSQKLFYKKMKSKIKFETGDYRHEIPSITPHCYHEAHLIFPLISDRFQPNCGFDTVGNMFRHLLKNIP